MKMTEACHNLAEGILKLPARSKRERWLKSVLVDFLTDRDTVNELAHDFEVEEEVQNPYLRELTDLLD